MDSGTFRAPESFWLSRTFQESAGSASLLNDGLQNSDMRPSSNRPLVTRAFLME